MRFMHTNHVVYIFLLSFFNFSFVKTSSNAHFCFREVVRFFSLSSSPPISTFGRVLSLLKKNHILVSSKVSVLLFLACVTTTTKQMERHYQRHHHPRCCLYLFTPPNVSHRFISLLCSRSIIECIRRAFAHCCCGLTFHQSLFCYGYVASVPVDSVESGLCKRFSKSFLCTSRHVL